MMKLPVKSVVWLMPLLLTGCFRVPFHKSRSVPSRMLAPRAHAAQSIPLVAVDLSPAEMVIAGLPLSNMPEEAQPIFPPAAPRRRRVNARDAVSAPVPQPISAITAIGQLSSGDPAAYRQQTANAIGDVEYRLDGIRRSLSYSEQRTAEHIREFLRQARAALATGDVEGAHTLAAKARVLLAELGQ